MSWRKVLTQKSSGRICAPLATSLLLSWANEKRSTDKIVVPAVIMTDAYCFNVKQILAEYGLVEKISQASLDAMVNFLLKQADAYGSLKANEQRGELNLDPDLSLPELAQMRDIIGESNAKAVYQQAVTYILRQFVNQGLAPSLVMERYNASTMTQLFSSPISLSRSLADATLRDIQQSYEQFIIEGNLTNLTTYVQSKVAGNVILSSMKKLVRLLQRSSGAATSIAEWPVRQALKHAMFGISSTFKRTYKLNNRVEFVGDCKYDGLNKLPKVAIQEYYLQLVRFVAGDNNPQRARFNWSSILATAPLSTDVPAFPNDVFLSTNLNNPPQQVHYDLLDRMFCDQLGKNIISQVLRPSDNVLLSKFTQSIDSRRIERDFVPAVTLREDSAVMSYYYVAFFKTCQDMLGLLRDEVFWPYEEDWKVKLTDDWFKRCTDSLNTHQIRVDSPKHLYDVAELLSYGSSSSASSTMAALQMGLDTGESQKASMPSSNAGASLSQVKFFLADNEYDDTSKDTYDLQNDRFFNYYVRMPLSGDLWTFPLGIPNSVLFRRHFMALKNKYFTWTEYPSVNPFPSILSTIFSVLDVKELSQSLQFLRLFEENEWIRWETYYFLYEVAEHFGIPLSYVKKMFPNHKDGDALTILRYVGPDATLLVWDPDKYPIYEVQTDPVPYGGVPTYGCWPMAVESVKDNSEPYVDRSWYLDARTYGTSSPAAGSAHIQAASDEEVSEGRVEPTSEAPEITGKELDIAEGDKPAQPSPTPKSQSPESSEEGGAATPDSGDADSSDEASASRPRRSSRRRRS